MRYLKLAMIFLTLTGIFAQNDLSEEEKALFKTNIIVPVPSEIIMALDILSDVNWKAIVVYDYSANYADNYKIALNLGVRVAQGFIAIQAEDRKNTGEMFGVSRDLAENFGAKSEMFVDKAIISKMLNEGKWLELRAVLDDIHLKVKEEMKKYDPDYVVLAGIGGWLEGLHIVSKALKSNYSEEASTILFQPELIDHFTKKINGLKKTNSSNIEVKEIIKKFPEIKKLCGVGIGNPIPLENINELYLISSNLIDAIVSETKRAAAADKVEEGSSAWTMIYSALFIVVLIVFIIRRKKGGK
ncbi:MAG: hypothetical protein KKD38_03840 [Candidatus Delongbacteria bacterium]|nr:hypothetical protein [Candidatus Delongbacteria bacterium]MCG2760081.1 hypothetical protein [Candidatus Delongbacteria bacterium]